MSVKNDYSSGVRGKVEVRLTGRETERFIKLCGLNGIELRRLRREDEGKGFFFVMWADEFFQLRPYLKKTKCRARIVGREGLPFYLKKRKRRWLFPVGRLMGAAMIFALSQFIWKIDFEGNVRYTDDMMYRFLEEQEVSFGTLKASVYTAGLEEAIRDYFEDITWVSVQLTGTHMIVSVKENDQLEAAVMDESPCDIVSTREGVITSMVVRSGQTSLREGDPVAAGQILISGRLELTDDGGTVTGTRPVHADGEIYASVSYQYEDSFLLSHEVRLYGEKTASQYSLVVGDIRIPLPVIGSLDSYYDVITEKNQLYLGSDLYFPAYIEKSLYRNYVRKVENYTEDEAGALARERMDRFLEKLAGEGYQIQTSELNMTITDGVCYVQGSYQAISQVGRQQAIDTDEGSREAENE